MNHISDFYGLPTTAPDPRLLLTPLILMRGRTLDSDIRYAHWHPPTFVLE
jgi:hypothetical protein